MDRATSVTNLYRSLLAVLLFAGMLVVAAPARSATIILDQSNVAGLPDGIDYLQVTIENGADGAIDFTVEALPALLDRAGDQFDIRAFAFNFSDSLALGSDNITGLPDNFDARSTSRMDGFGRFDMSLFGTGPERTESLKFSVVDVDGDTPEDYILLSTGNAGQGNVAFAARVRDLIEETVCNPDRKCTPHAIPSAFIGGGAGGAEVPLPATAWLLVTGFLGVLGRVRRRVARQG
jgi:hypothetical protein